MAEAGRTALDLAHRRASSGAADVMLSDLDDVALCTALQGEPQTAHIPILLISGGRVWRV